MHLEARQATTSTFGLPLPSTTPATPVPTSTSPATDASFAFLPLDNVTSCDASNVTWIVSNPELANLTGVGINLEVSGIDKNHKPANSTIVTNWPVLSSYFTWKHVDVGAGQHQIYGSWSDKHGVAVQSQVFNVKEGHTDSCIVSQPAVVNSFNAFLIFVVIIVAIGIFAVIAIAFCCFRCTWRRWRRRNALDRKPSASRDVRDGTDPPARSATDSADPPTRSAADSTNGHVGNGRENVFSDSVRLIPVRVGNGVHLRVLYADA